MAKLHVTKARWTLLANEAQHLLVRPATFGAAVPFRFPACFCFLTIANKLTLTQMYSRGLKGEGGQWGAEPGCLHGMSELQHGRVYPNLTGRTLKPNELQRERRNEMESNKLSCEIQTMLVSNLLPSNFFRNKVIKRDYCGKIGNYIIFFSRYDSISFP